MSRYSYKFIKASGADYRARPLIEAVVFVGLICFSILVLLNIDNTIEIFLMFLAVCFVYALIALLTEILPKSALILSLFLALIFLVYIVILISHELTRTMPNTLHLFNYFIVIFYIGFVGIVNIHLLRKFI